MKGPAGRGDAGPDALYLMEWDGSDVRRLATGIRGGEIWPFSRQSWSPDGDRLVTHDGNGQIWAVGLDNSGALVDVERLRTGYFPTYAPVGAEILDYDGSIFEDVQGGSVAASSGFSGQWSPDATQLVRVEGGNLEVFDRATAEITVIAAAEPSSGLTGTFLTDEAQPSWQRVAP